jgi:hypothetical protein
MSRDLLLRLQRGHAFDHSPLRHDLGVYHVPFDQLAPVRSPEDLLAGAAQRAERVAIVGRSGSGKSSLIEHVLGPSTEGVAPIAVPVFAEPADVVRSLQAIGGLIIQTLVDSADMSDAGRRAALESARATRTVSPRRRTTALSLGGGWMGAELSAEVHRQAPRDLELPRTVTEACNGRFETITPPLVDQAAAW